MPVVSNKPNKAPTSAPPPAPAPKQQHQPQYQQKQHQQKQQQQNNDDDENWDDDDFGEPVILSNQDYGGGNSPRSIRSTPRTNTSPHSMNLGDSTPLYDEN